MSKKGVLVVVVLAILAVFALMLVFSLAKPLTAAPSNLSENDARLLLSKVEKILDESENPEQVVADALRLIKTHKLTTQVTSAITTFEKVSHQVGDYVEKGRGFLVNCRELLESR